MEATNLYEQSRAANAANRELRAERYTGKNRFLVSCGSRTGVAVFAPDPAAAMWAAAKHWGLDPRKAEFHQNCRVKRC